MNKTIKIYTLSHPLTNEVRYIGKTIQTLEYRLTYGHLKECYRSNTHKNCWIKGLLNQGLSPKIDLLDEIPKCKNWEWLEQY